MTEAAKNIKESAKLKESCNDLYLEIVDKDLIAAEFKCHHECRIDLIRKEKEYTKRSPIGDFMEVIRYIDKYVLEMNQVISMKKIFEIFMGPNMNN